MDQPFHGLELKDIQKGYLTLPIDEDDFKGFIAGLLGKPQTITRRIGGTFEIHLSDLQNFHELINQRVIQQNGGTLIQLKTKVYYSDESTVLFSSYDELITYNEIKPVISEAVRLNWSYLIKFPDKKVPEKQEVEIFIVSTRYRRRFYAEEGIGFNGSDSEMQIIIQHTARSWGSDIESLLTSQIRSLLIPRERWRTVLQKYSVEIGFLTGCFVIFSSFLGIYSAKSAFISKQLELVTRNIKETGINVVEKIDFLT